MNPVLKKFVGLVPIALGIAAFWYLTWPKTPPPDNFWCVLRAEHGNKSYPMGGLTEQIDGVHISGLAKQEGVDDLYTFKGQATLSIAAKTVLGSVRGNVFTDGSREPRGLLLWVKSNAIGADELTIMTLNRDGILDFSRSQAFLHIGQSRSDRLLHPAAMRCRATI